MIGLLDTHAFIWWDELPVKLSAVVHAFIRDPANVVFVSVVSAWEMSIKAQLGKLKLHALLQDIFAQQQKNGIQILAVNLDHVFALDGLPLHHKDPFDRLLAAQANSEGAVLITADPVFTNYPVNVLW